VKLVTMATSEKREMSRPTPSPAPPARSKASGSTGMEEEEEEEEVRREGSMFPRTTAFQA